MSRKAAAAGDLENWIKNPRVACHLIPGTDPPVLVDVFKRIPPGDFTFFLSHFHSDHYGGLSKRWTRGVVHCSAVTGRMLSRSLGVDPSYVNHLELDTEYAIGGAIVTLVDANHCPGAAMILFRTRDGRVYLHTGDFRFDPQMLQKPILTQRKIDILYLDTTYAAPDYAFVSQSESLRQAVDISKKTPASGTSARTLFLVGAYATGKEKVAFALAEAHGWRIYASGGRRCILDCQDLSPERRALITSNAAEASVHLVPMGTVGSVLPYFRPNFAKIQSYLKEHHLTDIFSNVVGLLPTGWSLTTKWNKEHAVVVSGSAAVHLLEYSEHSSYAELRAFVLGLNPALVVPTVFSSNKNYDTLLEEWQPSKLAAQVALENGRQQSTKRKRDGEAVEGDRTQRRITAFFRHKTRVAANVHSEEQLASQNKPAASGMGSAGGTQGKETAAAAADALPTAVGGLSAACNGQPREAAAGGEETAGSVKVAGATAAVVFEVDLGLETAACTCEQAAGATPEGPAAAGCRPHEHSIEQSSGHTTIKPEPTSSVALCTASDFRLKEKQAECSVVTDKGRISATHVNNNGNNSSTSYHGNGSCSCTSTTSVVGSSSSSSSSSGPNSIKLEQSVGTAVRGNGARTSLSSFGNGVSIATVSSPLTAKSSHKSERRLGAIQASRGARACGSDSCSSNTSSIHTLPLSWIQRKGSAAAAGTTTSWKGSSSAKSRQNIVSKTQISLPSASTDSSVAAEGENQEGTRQAVPTEEEIIEISDD